MAHKQDATQCGLFEEPQHHKAKHLIKMMNKKSALPSF
jgi:hypothetical protein